MVAIAQYLSAQPAPLPALAPNLAMAQAFLKRLDAGADAFTFQTFDDTSSKRPRLARIHHVAPKNGALQALANLSAEGAGVFVTVNETDGQGRQAHNIKRVRAVFLDLDGVPLEPVLAAPLEPHFAIETSPGKYHAYWLVDDCELGQFECVQRALAARFDGDASVHDLPRVMRLPGFPHRKGEPFLSHMIEGVGFNGPPYTLAAIIAALDLDLTAVSKPAALAVAKSLDDAVTEGDRNLHLFARGRSMAKGGMTREAVLAALEAESRTHCVPPLPAAQVAYLADRAFEAKDSVDWQRGDAVASGAGTIELSLATPAPLDILRALAAPPLQPSDAPTVLGRFAQSQSDATGFDVSILLAAGIGATCAMLSDDVRLLVDGRSEWFESARLWTAIIGGPGAGKSPGIRSAMKPVFATHRELCAAWSNEHKDAKAEERPAPPALYVSDATTEALAELLAANTRGVLYMTDELESWLSSHDAYRNGAGKDRGEWLRLYDGGPHQVNRIKRGAFSVRNWGASLLTATTPAALRKLAPKLPADGLLQRFLLVVARSSVLPDDGVLRFETTQSREAWDSTLRRLYAAPAITVRLSPDAKGAFDVERAQMRELTHAFEDINPSLAAHFAKRTGMLARLALVFHALEAPSIEVPISGETMERAIGFLRRQERHARAVYDSMLGADTGLGLAKDIARSVLAAGLQAFNRRELAHKCKAFRLADEQTRYAALIVLRDYGWITARSEPLMHGAQWAVDPRVHDLYADHGEAARKRRELVRSRLAGEGEHEELDE